VKGAGTRHLRLVALHRSEAKPFQPQPQQPPASCLCHRRRLLPDPCCCRRLPTCSHLVLLHFHGRRWRRRRWFRSSLRLLPCQLVKPLLLLLLMPRLSPALIGRNSFRVVFSGYRFPAQGVLIFAGGRLPDFRRWIVGLECHHARHASALHCRNATGKQQNGQQQPHRNQTCSVKRSESVALASSATAQLHNYPLCAHESRHDAANAVLLVVVRTRSSTPAVGRPPTVPLATQYSHLAASGLVRRGAAHVSSIRLYTSVVAGRFS
jgi:hypothetical protein